MKRPKGPELKMPDLKVPAFLADVYYDLRDRRLLPLIGLVVVAIVATPFLLGQKPETTAPPETPGVIQALKESGGRRVSSLTVVEANPGLRDYRKRLRGREPLDPFRVVGKPSLKGAQLNEVTAAPASGSSGETSSTSTTNGSSAGGGSAPAPSGGGAGGGGAQPGELPPSGKGHLVLYSYAIDVRIVKSVGGQAQEPIVRKRVLMQTPLPGEKEPVVTFMGPAREGEKATGKALLLVSNQVTEIAGDAKCLSGDEICQLLEVEPGFPVVLTYGEDGVKYTIDVLKLGLVVTGHT
ncbi:MAG TPA: hypothetical protein VF085_02815 [Solirubrobacterales bacterium]